MRSPTHTQSSRSARAWLAIAFAVAPLAVCVVQGPAVAHGQTPAATDLQTTKADPTTMGTDLTTGPVTTLETTHPTWTPPHPLPPKPTESAAASDSASASSSGDDLGPAPLPPAPGKKGNAKRTFESGVGDVTVKVVLPADWPAMDDDALPAVDSSSMPDATIVFRGGYGWNEPKDKKPKVQELVVVCGKATTELWADNIRDAAFVSMIDGVETEAKKFTDLKEIDPPAAHSEGDRLVQPFSAEASYAPGGKQGDFGDKKGTQVKIEGLSFLGFVGGESGNTLVGCTVTCAQLVGEGDDDVCTRVAQSIDIKGTFVAPPKSTWWAQFLFTLKHDKTTLILIVVGFVFFVALIVLLVMMLRRRKHAAADAGPDDADDEGFDAGYEAGLAAARAELARAAISAPPPASASTPPISVKGSGSLPGISAPQAPVILVPSEVQLGSEVLTASPPPPAGYFDPITMEPR